MPPPPLQQPQQPQPWAEQAGASGAPQFPTFTLASGRPAPVPSAEKLAAAAAMMAALDAAPAPAHTEQAMPQPPLQQPPQQQPQQQQAWGEHAGAGGAPQFPTITLGSGRPAPMPSAEKLAAAAAMMGAVEVASTCSTSSAGGGVQASPSAAYTDFPATAVEVVVPCTMALGDDPPPDSPGHEGWEAEGQHPTALPAGAGAEQPAAAACAPGQAAAPLGTAAPCGGMEPQLLETQPLHGVAVAAGQERPATVLVQRCAPPPSRLSPCPPLPLAPPADEACSCATQRLRRAPPRLHAEAGSCRGRAPLLPANCCRAHARCPPAGAPQRPPAWADHPAHALRGKARRCSPAPCPPCQPPTAPAPPPRLCPPPPPRPPPPPLGRPPQPRLRRARPRPPASPRSASPSSARPRLLRRLRPPPAASAASPRRCRPTTSAPRRWRATSPQRKARGGGAG
jgi:hypothetical protein